MVTSELEKLILDYAIWLDNRRKITKFRLSQPNSALLEEFCKINKIPYYKNKNGNTDKAD